WAWEVLLRAQGFHARQLLAFQELQGRSAARGYMCDLFRYTRCVHGRHRISSTHDRSRLSILSDSVRDLHRPLREWRHFKDTHRPVPDDGGRDADLCRKELDG